MNIRWVTVRLDEYERTCIFRPIGSLQRTSALDDPEQNDNDCDDEQNVDEPVHRHGRQEAEEPENDEYDSERPQHVQPPSILSLAEAKAATRRHPPRPHI